MNRIYFVLIIVFLTTSCLDGEVKKQDKIVVSIDTTKIDTTVVEELLNDLDEKMKTEKQLQDCIFDQATQTDDFLKGIKEFEGYLWDDKTKTAEIVLNDHWSLTIKRGGCDHFAVNSDFIYDRLLDFEENKEMIFNKIIWISNLIEDYDGEKIEQVILNEKIDVQVEDNKRHIHFIDENLYEPYYMSFYTDEESSYIHLSYFIN